MRQNALCLALTSLITLSFSHTAIASPKPQQKKIVQAKKLFIDGLRDYEQGKLDLAVSKLRKANRIAPSPELTFNLGSIYERMGEAKRGIREFKHYLKTAKLSPKERRKIEKRIEGLQRTQQRQKNQIYALPPSKSALTKEARVFFKHGVKFFNKKQYTAALQAFTAAHQYASLPEVLFNMAIVSEKLSMNQDAIDYYKEYARSLNTPSEKAFIQRKIQALKAIH